MIEFSRRDLIAASRVSLQAFAERALYELIPGYKHFRYVDLMGAYLEALIGGEMSRLIMNLPPRHGKTLYCAALSAFFLGKYPGLEVLNVSHSQTLAKYLSQQTFDLMETAFYKEVFPNTRIRGDRRSAGDFRTTAGGGRLGVTVDSSITGRGADLIIIDDPLSAQDAFSEQIRENLKNSFDSMVATRLNDHTTGRILLVAHRLHEDDLTGHLLKKGYPQLSLPFEAKEDEGHEFRGVTYTRTEGELLQPTRFPPAALARLKAEMPAHHYATQYQQVPTAAGSGMVRREDFPLVDELPRGGETIISWDTASSLSPAASYSVALVFQLIGDVSYFRHIFRQRVVYEELKSSASSLHLRFKPSIHLVEAASLGKALAAELRAVGGNAIEVSPGIASKVARLEAQLHRIKSQSVQIPAGLPGQEDFLNEVTVFPHAASDDQVDALTQYLSWWTERGDGNANRSVLVAPRAGLNTRMGVMGGIVRVNGLPTRRRRF